MKILCSCCRNPLIIGDERIGFLVTCIYLDEEVPEDKIIRENDGLHIKAEVLEAYGLKWNPERGFWETPKGKIISSGVARMNPNLGVFCVRLKEGMVLGGNMV